MVKLCHGHRCVNTLLDKVFLFWLCLGDRKSGSDFATKLNLQLCFMGQD